MRRTRRSRDLSLAAVERLTGGEIRKEALASWERVGPSARRPHLEHLARLAEFYEVPVTAFIPAQRGSVEQMVPLSAVLRRIEELGAGPVDEEESVSVPAPRDGEVK